jgi:hypothetical protein
MEDNILYYNYDYGNNKNYYNKGQKRRSINKNKIKDEDE